MYPSYDLQDCGILTQNFIFSNLPPKFFSFFITKLFFDLPSPVMQPEAFVEGAKGQLVFDGFRLI